MRQERRYSFADEAGEWTLISRERIENGALLELWRETQCSCHVETGISWTFLSCMKDVKCHFAFPEGMWDFSGDCSRKGPHLALRGESHVFSRNVAQSLGFLSSCDGDLRDPLVLPQRSRVSSQVVRGTSEFLASH